MIKRVLTIILFLALSLFLVMPVKAADDFTKEVDIYPTDLDYRNSLIDWNGFNIELDFYWDKKTGGNPTTSYVAVYIGGAFSFSLSSWTYEAETDQYKLDMTQQQNQILKSILFSRVYNLDNYITIAAVPQTSFYIFAFRLRFKSLLNINVGTIYTSDNWNDPDDAISQWTKYVTFFNDGLPVAYSYLDDETTQTENVIQNASYTFSNIYTRIEEIYITYYSSKNASNQPAAIYTFIAGIGIFADQQTILPNLDIDTDFQIYAPTICGALDFACVSRNLIGEFSNNIYNQLGAEVIAGGVMVIYDTLFYPVYIVDDTGWQNGIISLYAMLVLGVLYLIVKRVLS